MQKIVEFRAGDLRQFGPLPRLPYPWLQRRFDTLPKRRGRQGRTYSMLDPWLERACIEFGGQFRSEYTIHGTLIVNPLAVALVRYHLPYVQSAAWRMWSRRHPKKREHALEFGDLVSAGLEGLAQATRAWKPGKGALNAFARPRIWGSICNALYDDLHPRGTTRGTPPIIHQGYEEWMPPQEADPDELDTIPGLPFTDAAPHKKKNKGRSPCLLTGYYTERRDLFLMRKMGRQAFADYLVWRKYNVPPPPVNEPPTPYVSKIAAYYRKKGWDIPTLMLDESILELRALEQRTKPTTNIKQKVAI
jgi:hypothetical protein